MNVKVDDFLNNINHWQVELARLREIMLACNLTEDFKWKLPCYTYKNKNIVLIYGLKNYCAVTFYRGALLKDSKKILTQQTKNVQSGRQIRFTNVGEINQLEETIKAYIFEAVKLEEQGLKVEYKKTSEFEIPEELELKFKENRDFEVAFKNLTPGRQRGYLLHFSQPKQAKTRIARIEKNINRILKGKGLHDCICGRSKKMPNCDGSHKFPN